MKNYFYVEQGNSIYLGQAGVWGGNGVSSGGLLYKLHCTYLQAVASHVS